MATLGDSGTWNVYREAILGKKSKGNCKTHRFRAFSSLTSPLLDQHPFAYFSLNCAFNPLFEQPTYFIDSFLVNIVDSWNTIVFSHINISSRMNPSAKNFYNIFYNIKTLNIFFKSSHIPSIRFLPCFPLLYFSAVFIIIVFKERNGEETSICFSLHYQLTSIHPF